MVWFVRDTVVKSWGLLTIKINYVKRVDNLLSVYWDTERRLFRTRFGLFWDFLSKNELKYLRLQMFEITCVFRYEFSGQISFA